MTLGPLTAWGSEARPYLPLPTEANRCADYHSSDRRERVRCNLLLCIVAGTLYPAPTVTRQPPLDRVRQRVLIKGYSYRAEKSYTHWIKRYLLCHDKRHLPEMSKPGVGTLLSYLTVAKRVVVSTQKQALGAPLFLLREVMYWSKKSKCLPVRSFSPMRKCKPLLSI